MNTVITIGRQFGSRGRDIGRLVAEHFDIPFYDKELIELAAQKSGINTGVLSSFDEKPTSSFLYSLSVGSYPMSQIMAAPDLPMNDKLFIIQSDIIKELATRGPCVVVGRCSEFVLKDLPNLLRVFIRNDLRSRVEWIAKRENVSLESAADLVKKIDRRRRSYYNFFSHQKWGEIENYDICINSGMGIETSARIIEAAVENK